MLKDFQEKDPQYKCACCGIHVQRAALAVGVTEAIRTVGLLVITMGAWHLGTCDDVKNYMCSYMTHAVLYGTVSCALLAVYTVVSLTLLFLGLCSASPGLLVPHIVAQALWLMYMSIMAGCYLIWGRGNGMLYLLCVLYVLNFGFEIWFVRIVVECWQFFQTKRHYLKSLFFTDFDAESSKRHVYRTTKNIVLTPLMSDNLQDERPSTSTTNGEMPLRLNEEQQFDV